MKTITQYLKVATIRRWTALTFTAWGLLVSWQAGAAVGSWIPLSKTAGATGGHMLLLSDGTVMVQNATGSNWFQLMPDSTGGYTNGNWRTNLSPMSTSRQFYSSVILPDGRVFVAGGEHHNPLETNNGEIYNPLNDHWTTTASVPTVDFRDSESEVLSNGNVLIHPVRIGTNAPRVTLIYNPTLDSWAPNPPSSLVGQGEASWVKLPDDSILTIEARTSERYIPSLNQWVADAAVPVNTYSNSEIGAGFLLPDGRAFFLGGSGKTAIYTPSPLGGTNKGMWAQGTNIPDGRVTSDIPAAMMANGKILCAVGSSSPNGGSPAPTWFYEYDYAVAPSNAFTLTSSPGNPTVGSSYPTSGYNLSLLDLPDGTILFSDAAGPTDPYGQLYVYKPGTPPLAAGKPAISSITANIAGVSYHLTGTLFNGISEGAAFGDDAQMASNYPLVRFTDGLGNVYYGRTYNWSSTGVMTGSTPVTTEFTVPGNVPAGNYSLAVVANGIASDPVSFTYSGPVWVDFNYSSIFGFYFGTYTEPYNTLASGVSAVASGGTIALKPGSSSETLTINKAMIITAVGGPATIGH
jgi:hypothetical protein